MAGRRPQGPPPIQSKDFTLEDIENGIRKLKRRIEDVKALDPNDTRYDDHRVEAATRDIQADIGDIFGRNSHEYSAHGNHSVGYPSMLMAGPTWSTNATLRGICPTPWGCWRAS